MDNSSFFSFYSFLSSRYNPRELGTYVAMQILYRHFDPIAQEFLNEYSYSEKKLGNYQPQHVARDTAHYHHQHHGHGHSSHNQQQQQQSIASYNDATKKKVLKFVLPRSSLVMLPGDLVYFCAVLPKPSNDVTTFITDNAVTSSQQFGPAPPRRIVTLKVCKTKKNRNFLSFY
jgi:hypothetical protein